MKKAILLLVLILISCSKDNSGDNDTNEKLNYNLTVTAGDGGSVDSSGGTYPQGTRLTISALPEEGYSFDKWSGTENSTSNPLNIVLNANENIIANFSLNTYAIEINGTAAKGAFVAGSRLTFYELNEELSQTGKTFDTNIIDDYL